MVASAKADKVKPPVFNPVELARGWRVLREHLQIRVDVEKRTLAGKAHFTFCALNNQFVNIALNLRRCRVKACYINGNEAPYRLVSPLDDDELLDAVSRDATRYRVRDVDHSMRLRENASAEQGELMIDLPISVSADIIEELIDVVRAHNVAAGKPDEKDMDLPPNFAPPVPLEQLPVVNLTLEYEILDPTAGAVYYGDLNAQKTVLDPLYMITESRFGMARCWMPCIDTINWCDRYLFDLDVAVKSDLTVIASGELKETVQYPQSDTPDTAFATKVFKYQLHAPAHASEIVVAVGPFVALPDPTLSSKVTHFCLPGLAEELVHTAPELFAKALAFCRDYFGADPPSCSFKQLFAGSMGLRAEASVTGAGGIVVHSGDLLHTARCIDESLIAREAIMSGLVTSYFGRFLRPRLSEDEWLINGLVSHVTALGLQAMLGRNWYRFHIADRMEELCAEESVALADTPTSGKPDKTIASVRRRSHIIVYMIDRRISSDVMKRALRDIVAEGRSSIITAIKTTCLVLSKRKPNATGIANGVADARSDIEGRPLTDLNGVDPGNAGVVSSGFDDAIQGVGVAPFLKRIRAIMGSDVRGLVRLWAGSPGVPRLRVGYQYNVRKHAIEFVVKQDGVVKGERYSGRRGLPFSGMVNIRVMEVEGVYDHSIEITDAVFSTELQCHSRRAKVAKPAPQAEKDVNDNPARISPVLWIRFDPDNDWCTDYVFRQTEDSWLALLKGERDAIGQYEACKGLGRFDGGASAEAVLSLLKDDQVYWRVRAQAANVLASSEEGLKKLLDYFRSCYTDGHEGSYGLLRPNNFGNIASYFVKRAMVRAIAGARVKGSRTANRPGGSMPVEATKFLAYLLSGHDNAGNEYDDDHYVVDLVKAVASAAECCVNDERHDGAGDEGMSTTEALTRQLERFRSIEEMVPRRSDLVMSAISTALTSIEVAVMTARDSIGEGVISATMLSSRFAHNAALVRRQFELFTRQRSFDSRLAAAADLARAYGGDLEVVLWILARVDGVSSGEDMIQMRQVLRKSENPVTDYGYAEVASFRYRLLDVICEAVSAKGWYKSTAPILLALRRQATRAVQVCNRVLKLIVADPDPRIRTSALRLAQLAWAGGVPACLLDRFQYLEARRAVQLRDRTDPVNIVPLKRNEGMLPPQTTEPVRESRPAKSSKSSKTSRHSKNGKLAKGVIKKFSVPRSQTIPVTTPSVQPKPPRVPGNVDAVETPKPAKKEKEAVKPIRIPRSVPTPDVVPVDTKPLPSLRSVPMSGSKKPSPSEPNFSWHPLDPEDLRLLEKAWGKHKRDERKNKQSTSGTKEARNLGVERGHELTGSGLHGSEAVHVDDDVRVVPNDDADLMGNGLDEEHRKKKKKKKRKRSHDDEDTHKKKKKKKKKRERDENGEPLDKDRGQRISMNEAPGEKRKIGKFKISLGSGAVAHVAKTE